MISQTVCEHSSLNKSLFLRLDCTKEIDLIRTLDTGNSKQFEYVFNKKLAKAGVPLRYFYVLVSSQDLSTVYLVSSFFRINKVINVCEDFSARTNIKSVDYIFR